MDQINAVVRLPVLRIKVIVQKKTEICDRDNTRLIICFKKLDKIIFIKLCKFHLIKIIYCFDAEYIGGATLL